MADLIFHQTYYYFLNVQIDQQAFNLPRPFWVIPASSGQVIQMAGGMPIRFMGIIAFVVKKQKFEFRLNDY